MIVSKVPEIIDLCVDARDPDTEKVLINLMDPLGKEKELNVIIKKGFDLSMFEHEGKLYQRIDMSVSTGKDPTKLIMAQEVD